MMKVIHVISSISPESGGPARSSQGLAAALEGWGVETWLVVFNQNDRPWVEGVRHFTAIGQDGYSQQKKRFAQIVDELKPDILHVHCLWDPVSHIACVVARTKGIPYVIAPRGMLDAWSLNQKKWKKKVAMFLYQRADLEKAVALHATAQSEAEQFRLLGFSQRVIVSPNGITLPKHTLSHAGREDGRKVILFLSRIHPKKGLLMLVEAVSRLKQMSRWEAWHVEYAGSDDDSHLRAVQDRIASLGLQNDFSYLGNLDDVRKWDAYSRANLFVLPTHSENFGIVVPEALYAGVPVITTTGTPWKELETERCGKWIEIGVEPLVVALAEMMSLSDEHRQEMGRRGRRLVERQYTWGGAAETMRGAYEELLAMKRDGIKC